MTSQAPLILIEDGYQRWKIMEPHHQFGQPLLASGAREERRYRTLCIVTDENMFRALEVLYQLEAARA